MRVSVYAMMLLVGCTLPAMTEQLGAMDPKAGTWKTWVITSGRQFRVPPPPDNAANEQELAELAQKVTERDRKSLDQIAYWDTGAPSYRWSEIAIDEHLK